MAFATFWNFILDLSRNPLPPRIDRSLMSSKSGTDQANLTQTLMLFGLISSEGHVQPILQQLAREDEAVRTEALQELLRLHYGEALDLAGVNGTEAQLNDVFRDHYGLSGSADTRRKAVTFFLHAAREAGLPLSPHFPKTRSGSGAPGTPRARPPRSRAKSAKPVQSEPSGNGASAGLTGANEFSTEVTIGAGTMRLTVSVNPLELSGDDRAFFFDIVDRMRQHAAGSQATSDRTGPASSIDEAEGVVMRRD
jgi:hypothetical protein